MVLICFLVFAFANAMSTALTGVYPGEIFPTEIRGLGTGFATAFSRVGAGLGTFLLPWSMHNLGAGITMLIAAGICVVGADLPGPRPGNDGPQPERNLGPPRRSAPHEPDRNAPKRNHERHPQRAPGTGVRTRAPVPGDSRRMADRRDYSPTASCQNTSTRRSTMACICWSASGMRSRPKR